MIREWLEAHGWTCVRSDDEGDLYTKGTPVCMNTEAALFQELLDIHSAAKHYQNYGVDLVAKRIDEVVAIRSEYREWLFHLTRLGLDGKSNDVGLYARRIANRLEGSDTAKTLRGLLAERGITGSPLREGVAE